MKPVLKYESRAGTFYICQSHDGRFHPVFREESLGSYSTPGQAIEDLAGGHTYSAPGVEDTASLGISDEQGDWSRADR